MHPGWPSTDRTTRYDSGNSHRSVPARSFLPAQGVSGSDELQAGTKGATLIVMSFDAATHHHCQFPGCERPSRGTPMALHLPEGDDHGRIAWVCAKHSLLFYANDPAVVAWLDESQAASRPTATVA
jgi:hypothetical protein